MFLSVFIWTQVLAGEAPGEFNRATAGTVVLQEWVVLLGYPKEVILSEAQSGATFTCSLAQIDKSDSLAQPIKK